MNKSTFENMLTEICQLLTLEAKAKVFQDSISFENRVRTALNEYTDKFGFKIDFNPHPQAFPDIEIGEFGIEVKFTLNDTWKSIANSILETNRIESVKYIYIIFCKMGGLPSVKWSVWDESIVHVRTSHVPRFEVEMPNPHRAKESLFKTLGITYDEFHKMPMDQKMVYIRKYARTIHPDGRLWWLSDQNGAPHTTPVQARLYTNLSQKEKIKLRAEAALLCPSIVKSGRSKNKYDDVVLFLLTYHGVICHQARDLFSAGSVANPKNDDNGGVYIERALKLIEKEMVKAAENMDGTLFEEYWGEKVEPSKRIKRWLEKADALAKDWTPSKSLFTDIEQIEA